MVAHEIGGAFVTYLNAKRIAVSRDMRVSSPALADAFIEGALRQGCDVVDYGMLPTDVMYYAVVRDGLDGGVQVTASHNPKQYNGIKMVRAGAQPLSGDAGIGEIRDMVVSKSLPPASARMGAKTQGHVLDDYVKLVLGFVDASLIKPFNVVLDAASGMAGPVAPKLFEHLACRTTRLAFEPGRHVPALRGQSPHRGEPQDHHRARQGGKGGYRHRLGRRRGSVFFPRRQRGVRAGRFRDGAARRGVSHQAARPGHPLRPARELRGEGHRGQVRGPGGDEPRRPRVLQGPHARGQRRLRRRGDRPLLLPRVLLLRQRLHPRPADAGADVTQEPDAGRAARAPAVEILHLGRDQHPRGGHVAGRGENRRTGEDARRRPRLYARWRVGRVPGLALQRARRRTPSRSSDSISKRRRWRRWRRSATKCSPTSGLDRELVRRPDRVVAGVLSVFRTGAGSPRRSPERR